MGLTIYGTARSRTARVLWMAKELGLAFEHVPLMMGDAALKQPAFLKINPAGRVPAIDDDGFVMAESLAINLYLARKYGDRASPSLAPASLEEEARIWQWSSWAMTDLEIPLNLIHLHRNFFPPEKRDANAIAVGKEKTIAAARIMDALYLRQVWAGNEPMLLDLVQTRSPHLADFLLYKGPWSRLDKNAPFVPGAPRKPEGANFYPPDASKPEIEGWLKKLPEAERADLVAELLVSLEGPPEGDDAAVGQAWAAELEGRARNVLAGESQGEAWTDVRDRVRRALTDG